jgi:hypothetical protein
MKYSTGTFLCTDPNTRLHNDRVIIQTNETIAGGGGVYVRFARD